MNKIFDCLCLDPDNHDPKLYQALGNKFNVTAKKDHLVEVVDNQKIKLSADVIFGWKQLLEYQPNFDKFIQDYAVIRGKLNLHFVWPKHRLSTINTYRYSNYNDRIDYLLFNLKCYFEGLETPMMKAYQKETTAVWLRQFKNSFAYFMDKMQLKAIMVKNNAVRDCLIHN